MDSIDKDLRSILQIRKMRADSLSRAARAREMERNSMAKDVVDKVQALTATEIQVRQLQQERLGELVSGQFVKIDRVEAFSKMQLRGVQQIMDANRDIELAQKRLESSNERLEESMQIAKVAEKKKIAIEEVIEWRKN
ncbi:hypothetical protein EV673_1771 [Limnobacter thiooxidans]|uniref:Type III secretion protein n=1 Tax=Limnobacter thiooxidans TaxID=131080 RepID=A0AA86J1Y6_9BURK|nr:hypothetical protein [Limnobacter sp.]MCZ8016151.1 hypothetical protein [Limnobacter sp.]RZS40014.1 hypothetical protein EV673_1771 [Limnobacter thiooxidans]BET27558.1 hypothetical protein RGQ30_30590 [Limnobacter thiooxidans]